MNTYETLCFLDLHNNDIKDSYKIYKNSLVYKKNNKYYNFTKISKSSTKLDFYYNNIIKTLRRNIEKLSTLKINGCYLLFGNLFDLEPDSTSYTISNLINDVINEYSLESFPFNITILELNSNNIYNFITNKFLFVEDISDNFIKQKIFLDPIDKNYNVKINDIKQIINLNMNNKLSRSFLFFTIENTFQKNTFYILNGLSLFSDKFFNPYSILNNDIMNELNNLTLFFLDRNNNYDYAYKKTKLIKFIQDDISTCTQFISIFGYIDNIKLLELSESIYQYFSNKNNCDNNQIIKVNNDSIENVIKDIGKVLFAINQIKSQNIENKPIDKQKYELVKYVPKNSSLIILPPQYIFERLNLMNKFIFNQIVKNQIKIQKANKNPELKAKINKELLVDLKSLMTVILDQLNLL